MKKYKYAGLTIELTRRCNMRCAHCLRGQAQDITLSKNIIDKMFDDITDCAHVYISGGEPLLELDTLIYLLEKIATNWNTALLEITTNGSILSDSLVAALEQFCQTPTSSSIPRKAHLTISKDEFHKSGEWQNALSFYTPLFNKANQRLGCSDETKMHVETWSPVDKEETKKNNAIPALLYAGNAIQLAKESNEFKIGKNLRVPSYCNHRLKIIDNIVYCRVMITAKGDVVVAAEDDSYAMYDTFAVGSILNKPLDEIIDHHQKNCLITCNESNFINSERQKQAAKPGDISFFDDIITKFLYKVITNIWNVREAVKIQYPILPAQDIIVSLPFPTSDAEVVQYANMVCQFTPTKDRVQDDEALTNLFLKEKETMSKKQRDICALIIKALTYLEHTDSIKLFVSSLLRSQLWLLQTHAKILEQNKFLIDNDWVFPCGSNDIFANRDIRDMRNAEC